MLETIGAVRMAAPEQVRHTKAQDSHHRPRLVVELDALADHCCPSHHTVSGEL